MAVATYTKSGTKATTPVKLDKSVFSVEAKNHNLLHLAYVAHQANARANLAVTKTRAEVSGGGRKPWRQKGLGRARVGSSRNPIWRGGGTAFGPTGNENYSKKMNQKAKQQAVRQALSLAVNDNKLIIIEDLKLADNKTKSVANLLKKIGAKNSSLIVVDQISPEFKRPFENLAGVKVISARYLSAFELINANSVILTKPALEIVTTWLGAKS